MIPYKKMTIPYGKRERQTLMTQFDSKYAPLANIFYGNSVKSLEEAMLLLDAIDSVNPEGKESALFKTRYTEILITLNNIHVKNILQHEGRVNECDCGISEFKATVFQWVRDLNEFLDGLEIAV